MSLPLPLPCRWCHHDDNQHDHADLSNPTALSPCRVEGCDCDDCEGDD